MGQTEDLPGYAPDLNPVEWLWRHLKEVEMANLTCLDLEELHEEFHLALGRVRTGADVLRGRCVYGALLGGTRGTQPLQPVASLNHEVRIIYIM